MAEPDDLVLLGLDRGDDVAHGLAAWGVQRGQEHLVAVGHAVVEDVVVEIEDAAPPRAEMTTPGDPLGIGGGGTVKWPRHRRTPIGEQRPVIIVLVEQTDSADVQCLARFLVEPTEAQPAVSHPQAPEPGVDRTGRHVALPQVFGGLGRTVAQHTAQLGGRRRPLGVEPAVEKRDVLSFRCELGIIPCFIQPWL
ncbi:MAG TPA: hypothetical protein VH969_01745 [Actinophytocola sp.]|uniref:hypothetical protein n=1 Tax=Actinophytocola sp. TaxID=1872138 RepID=UPI002F9201EE